MADRQRNRIYKHFKTMLENVKMKPAPLPPLTHRKFQRFQKQIIFDIFELNMIKIEKHCRSWGK